MFTCRFLKLFLAVLRSEAICFFCLYISFILKCSWSITATTRPKMRRRENRAGKMSSVTILYTCRIRAFSNLHLTSYDSMTHGSNNTLPLLPWFNQNRFPFSFYLYLWQISCLVERESIIFLIRFWIITFTLSISNSKKFVLIIS